VLPSDLDLPAKFTSWRPNQLELSAKIASSSKYGYLLDSPTGTGKSLVAAAAQRILGKNAVYLCLAKNNTVVTDKGFRLIQEIEVGDYVITSSGSMRPVTAIGSRKYAGVIINIRTAYHSGEILKLTPEHKVLVARRYRDGSTGRWLDYRQYWVRADELRVGDRLAKPSLVGDLDIASDQTIKIMAWYAAEGSIGGSNKGQISFAIGGHEIQHIKELEELLPQVSSGSIHKYNNGSVTQVVLYDPELAHTLHDEIGCNARMKSYPSWILGLGKAQAEMLLDTHTKGDGHEYEDGQVIIGTASRIMALQLRELAFRCGYPCSIVTTSRECKIRANSRGKLFVLYNVKFQKKIIAEGVSSMRSGKKANTVGGIIHVNVTNVIRSLYNDYVYDITVADEHNFTTIVGCVENCTTKQLQDQILKDFPYAKTLKGRSNYVCSKYPRMFPNISAENCTHIKDVHECDRRGSCPYIVAKMIALRSPLAVLNTSYFLSEANYVGSFDNLDFLIIDELDALESQLMGFIQLSVTKKQLDRINVAPPKYKTKFECWVEWATEMLRQLKPELARLVMLTEKSSDWGGIDIAELKRKSAVARLVSKLEFFVREVDTTWVPFYGEDEWMFKPTWVSKYSGWALWKHAKKVLGMSATILDPRQLSMNIGLTYENERTYEYKALPSPFPKEHRPIYYQPCANVINKNMDVALPRLAIAIERIMEAHPNDKILCHVVSYKIRDYLMKSISSDRLVTHDTATRSSVLEQFKQSDIPQVLLSPSMERGVDLPGEECRVIIIAKCPYPDLGDPQINKRVHASKDGNSWYAHKTVSAIVQMSGRAVRSVDDWAVTYILDEQFSKLFREWNNMFPSWYKEAVIM